MITPKQSRELFLLETLRKHPQCSEIVETMEHDRFLLDHDPDGSLNAYAILLELLRGAP